MNHPSDDTLNAAWNDVMDRPGSSVAPALGPADAALLRAMHTTAASVQPDPAFRDQLWAELSRRPASYAPAPAVSPSRPAAIRSGVPTMTPRLAPASRRWSPPIATIAAALVIALVGYGALSLSGATPTGLNLTLNDVPNASAQGQGVAQSDNPVVGTWAWLADFPEGPPNPSIVVAMTLDMGGGVTATAAGDWTGHGTWSANGDSISLQFSVLQSQEALEQQGYDLSIPSEYGQTNYVPNVIVWSLSFKLSDDGTQWENVEMDIEMGVQPTSYEVGSSSPGFLVVSDLFPGDEATDNPPVVRRLDSIIDSAPAITSEDAGLDSGEPESSNPPRATPVANIPETGTLPTPTATPPDPTAEPLMTLTPMVTQPAVSTPTMGS